MIELDAAAGAAGRDAALVRVDANADPGWKARALLAIYQVAVGRGEFTVDAVWEQLGERPREGRAMGARMRKAAAFGWIEVTEEYRATKQVSRHAAPVVVWRSRIYKEGLC